MKGKKYFVLSLILALLAAGAVYSYMNELEQQSKSAANLVPVYVAKADIPARSKLDETMFTKVEIPKGALHNNALTDLSAMSGAFAQERLLAGEQVMQSRLIFNQGQAGLSYKVSAGHRGVTVAVNSVSGVAGFILPGDYVDCIVTIDPPSSSSSSTVDESQTLTITVASNLRVLAAGQFTYEQDLEQLIVDTVTLDTPVDSVTAIIQASERGSLRLVLRPVDESNATNIRAHRLSQFIQ